MTVSDWFAALKRVSEKGLLSEPLLVRLRVAVGLVPDADEADVVRALTRSDSELRPTLVREDVLRVLARLRRERALVARRTGERCRSS